MSIWDDMKSGKLETTREASSAWNNLKESRLTEKDLLSPTPSSTSVIKADNEFPSGTITLDLETGSVDDLFRHGPEFIRLVGWDLGRQMVLIDVDPKALIEDIQASDGWVIGHNVINFDLIALARHTNLNILDLARKNRIIDTKLLAFLADPPLSRTKEGEIERMFSLDNTGLRYLGEGKVKDIVTGKSVLKELAKEYGGFDKIPQDHPKYIEYLKQDVAVTRDLAKVIPITDYAIREHKINTICSVISIEGFKVDNDLLEQRIVEGEEKRLTILNSLQGYGLPGPETTKAPHRTKAGVQAIDVAFSELGVMLPRTKTGRPALGKPVLEHVMETFDLKPEVVDLAESVLSLNGIRTIYQNIKDWTVGDKIHPSINLRQSSGRLSITKPGLTVVGKRGAKVKERAVFLPDDPTHVLVSCDLAQIDQRAIAALSQDYAYMDMFEPGRDFHSEMAERLLGDKSLREKAKSMSHGIPYGMMAGKLAKTAGISEYEAEEFLAAYAAQFPRLAEWQDKIREEGELSGVLYNGFGRLMRIEPERAFTQTVALMGQSTARDLLMEGILRLWDMGGDGIIKMIRGIIHDEIVCSVPKSDVDEIEHLIVDALSFEWCPVGGSRPIQVIAGLNQRGSDWMDCYRK